MINFEDTCSGSSYLPGPFPEIDPYKSMLDVGNDNLVFGKNVANPEGKSSVVLHYSWG
jgi:hypothetical protein